MYYFSTDVDVNVLCPFWHGAEFIFIYLEGSTVLVHTEKIEIDSDSNTKKKKDWPYNMFM